MDGFSITLIALGILFILVLFAGAKWCRRDLITPLNGLGSTHVL